ncbi:hypothetical protein [Streptomyces sp. NPDC020141]|uniref:hypothetical protein n=1 Tax=Streptomyces sp. NPDC020141 TaxID=3365065 RepID=UPI0037B239F2
MADERYEWLDQDTAERLLRGERVEAPGGPPRARAARLDRALRSVGRPGLPLHPEDGEMQGEAAALAAFRKVRADSAGAPGEGASLGVVRLARPPRSHRARLLPRTVRFGVVATVAGFAFGGVAVAAGAGLLPSPFEQPTASPRVAGGAAPPAAPGSERPTARPTSPFALGPTAAGELFGSPSADGAPRSRNPTPSPSVSGPSGAVTGTPERGGGRTGDEGWSEGHQQNPGGTTGEEYRVLLDDCRAHRDGSIGSASEKRLERVARGSGRVTRFCDRLLGGGDFGSHGPDAAGGDRTSSGPAKPDKFGEPSGNRRPGRQPAPGHSHGSGSGHDGGSGEKDPADGKGGKPDKGAKPVKPAKPTKSSKPAKSGESAKKSAKKSGEKSGRKSARTPVGDSGRTSGDRPAKASGEKRARASDGRPARTPGSDSARTSGGKQTKKAGPAVRAGAAILR